MNWHAVPLAVVVDAGLEPVHRELREALEEASRAARSIEGAAAARATRRLADVRTMLDEHLARETASVCRAITDPRQAAGWTERAMVAEVLALEAEHDTLRAELRALGREWAQGASSPVTAPWLAGAQALRRLAAAFEASLHLEHGVVFPRVVSERYEARSNPCVAG